MRTLRAHIGNYNNDAVQKSNKQRYFFDKTPTYDYSNTTLCNEERIRKEQTNKQTNIYQLMNEINIPVVYTYNAVYPVYSCCVNVLLCVRCK